MLNALAQRCKQNAIDNDSNEKLRDGASWLFQQSDKIILSIKVNFVMKLLIFKPIALILISICLTAGADENTKKKTDMDFYVVIGAQSRSDIKPCADYASKYSYTGKPYYVFVPETRKTITRHEGMDFCAKSGSDVLASAAGKIVYVEQDNPYRGGRVTIETNLIYDQYGNEQIKSFLYVDALHITPRAGLKNGDLISAGDVIGSIQPGGKQEIGPTSHVHLSVGPSIQTWTTHTDPNRFWQKGAGIVTCFDSTNPPTDQQLVAPIRCK